MVTVEEVMNLYIQERTHPECPPEERFLVMLPDGGIGWTVRRFPTRSKAHAAIAVSVRARRDNEMVHAKDRP